ncbi:lysophospholipase [Roseivirga sp. 4D4]|uniref:SGNH/GDSL hydrolase family protein n=1 Tax=Roseivirga sp. 4D4 TaxID=1889784 RepID=UPI0008531AD4|nr:SGNH/GDSL hydrolase family protein [Roseivirga sp. 4D4]OEK01401.1 lysophospholipase [Roseivirga sp. 4D4]
MIKKLKLLFALALLFSTTTIMAQKTYLALGDSYTIGESVDISERWPVQLVKTLNDQGTEMAEPKIIATTGWRTDDLQKGIREDKGLLENYDLVSLLIGVNNQYQGKAIAQYKKEFEELINTAIKFAGNNPKKVFVVSIPDYGKTPFGAKKEKQIAKELDEYNRIAKHIALSYGIPFFNITPISREAKERPELIAKDKLHPSGKMYSEWVALFADDVAKIVKQ